MRLRIFSFAFVILLLASTVSWAGDGSASNGSTFLTPGKIYNYKVNVNINGQVRGGGASPDLKKLEVELELTVRQKVDKGLAPGETQSAMSVQSAMLVAGQQKIQLAPSTFPQVTVLIDGTGTVTKVFGASGPGLPGLNFSNFMLLLLPSLPKNDPAQMKAGDQWTKEVILNDTGQAVKVASTFKVTEKVGDTDTVLVNQAFELAPAKADGVKSNTLKSVKGTAVCNYALPELRPYKAHADVEVTGRPAGASAAQDTKADNSSSAGQDTEEFQAKLSIDLIALK